MRHFKRHPKRQHLYIKEDGSELRYYSEPLEIIDHEARPGNIIKVVIIEGVSLSVPKLILETYTEKPDDEHRYYAQYRDGNIENLHPKNLYWSRNHKISAEKRLKNSTANSKLTFEQTKYIYEENVLKNVPKSKLADVFDTSSASILRAVRRYQKYLDSLSKT